MEPLLLVSPVLSFVVAFILTRRWIPVAHRVGIVGKDMNKPGRPEVAEMGGVPVFAGVASGLMFYIAINSFVLNQRSLNLPLFAALSTIFMITIVGIIDDSLGWKIGLKQWHKPLLTIPAAVPMMAAGVGISIISLPLVGTIDLGLLYPLLIIPIGIVGASNGFNMLAGYNGLEAGMGVIILSAMSLYAYAMGDSWVAMIGISTIAALLAFLYFNWYPAKVFPGNTLTYMVGAIMACMAILGNMEKLALILFIPYYMDFILPLRAKMKTEAFGKVNEDGTLDQPYNKIYDVTHLFILIIKKIKRRVYEKDVTVGVILLEACIASVATITFLLLY
ncbi:MAG: hypothetical protein QXN15_10830 [Candidatus Jordarchaeales archaeon]|nr:glycosyl transferase family 4 [Candidatus Jordarchaeia archaeon]